MHTSLNFNTFLKKKEDYSHTSLFTVCTKRQLGMWVHKKAENSLLRMVNIKATQRVATFLCKAQINGTLLIVAIICQLHKDKMWHSADPQCKNQTRTKRINERTAYTS